MQTKTVSQHIYVCYMLTQKMPVAPNFVWTRYKYLKGTPSRASQTQTAGQIGKSLEKEVSFEAQGEGEKFTAKGLPVKHNRIGKLRIAREMFCSICHTTKLFDFAVQFDIFQTPLFENMCIYITQQLKYII